MEKKKLGPTTYHPVNRSLYFIYSDVYDIRKLIHLEKIYSLFWENETE